MTAGEQVMKTIVVSGSSSNVGKTSLAEAICALLPRAVHVKIGHGEEKAGIGNVFYHAGTPFGRIAADNSGFRFLVIESNRILEEIEPDCAIFLAGEETKPTAGAAREKADIVRGVRIGARAAAEISGRLSVPLEKVIRIIELAGAIPSGREDMEKEQQR